MNFLLIHYYNITPFSSRIGQWLSSLRTTRVEVNVRKTTKRISKTEEEKFMERILQRMTPTQMEGYLKGLKDGTSTNASQATSDGEANSSGGQV
jgi:hypothetical protein